MKYLIFFFLYKGDKTLVKRKNEIFKRIKPSTVGKLIDVHF